MRFKSPALNGFQVFAISGVNTISFGIKASETARKGLLGFAVERIDAAEDERYTLPGFKVFRSLIPKPTQDTHVSTRDHPVQSLVWDDFTAKPNHEYEYVFHPIKGKPKNLDRSEKPISIRVKTEPLFSKETHDVFFNRGVASSQAYRRRFGNLPPKKLTPSKRAEEALNWLTRDLDDAITRFIRNAKKGDTLLGCFYEFRYEPVARELKQAISRKVNVHLIIDGKVNEHMVTDKKTGKKSLVESFPRLDNLKMLKKVGIPKKNFILRQAKPDKIAHNKFMVLLRGGKKPTEVWTGSTNISEGGFSGQTNVGHWVRDPEVAKQFFAYWELLSKDPGAKKGFDRSKAMKANKDLHAAVGKLRDVPTIIKKIKGGTTPVFSPRAGLDVLRLYVEMVNSGKLCSCITLAFGIGKEFREKLRKNTSLSNLVFILEEKEDVKNPRSKEPFVKITAANNVYQAFGSFIDDPVYNWARETNTRKLELNQHVAYIHSKFLLMDPLGDDPIVVTGSANFSEASTNENDENMLIIRGDHRVADIYFTEFNRLFNHYYFRSVVQLTKKNGQSKNSEGSLFLAENDKWLEKYKPGKLRAKRLKLYTDMDGAKTI
jgi:phosphatidylserine/phosphatidylglycerophosphate/cardiolipin synthase-like enzyme